MHNCHLSNLLEMKIPGPHFRAMASESLGWVPRICIFKRTIIAPHTHPLWHSQAAPWCQGLRTLKLVPVYCWTSFFPPLPFLFPRFSPPSVILCYRRQERDTLTFVGATHASLYFLTKTSFWNLLWFLSRSQEHPKTHQSDFRVI